MADWNINAHIAKRAKDIIDEATASVERMVKRVEQTILARLLLGDTGVTLPKPTGYWDHEDLQIDATKEQLPLIRKALDCPLVVSGKYLEDEKERIIRVNLEPKDFPTVTITYRTTLPKPRRGKKGAKAAPKCKIVTVHHKAYKTKALVCDSTR